MHSITPFSLTCASIRIPSDQTNKKQRGFDSVVFFVIDGFSLIRTVAEKPIRCVRIGIIIIVA